MPPTCTGISTQQGINGTETVVETLAAMLCSAGPEHAVSQSWSSASPEHAVSPSWSMADFTPMWPSAPIHSTVSRPPKEGPATTKRTVSQTVKIFLSIVPLYTTRNAKGDLFFQPCGAGVPSGPVAELEPGRSHRGSRARMSGGGCAPFDTVRPGWSATCGNTGSPS